MKILKLLSLNTLFVLLATVVLAQSPKIKAEASLKEADSKIYQIEVTVENVKGVKYSVPGVLVNEYDEVLEEFFTEEGIANLNIKPNPQTRYYVKIAGIEGKNRVGFPYDDNTGYYGIDPDDYHYLPEYDYLMTPYVVEAKRISNQRLLGRFGYPNCSIKFNKTFESMPYSLYSLIGRVPGVRFLPGQNGFPQLEIRENEPIYYLDGQRISDKKFIDALSPAEIYEVQVWHMTSKVVSVITKNG
jgi:hypothetical protein